MEDFSKSENKETNQTKEDESVDKKIKISPNAFDSVINYHTKQKEFWEYLEQEELNKETIIKIGKFEQAENIENRLFSFIVKDEDLSTKYQKD